MNVLKKKSFQRIVAAALVAAAVVQMLSAAYGKPRAKK